MGIFFVLCWSDFKKNAPPTKEIKSIATQSVVSYCDFCWLLTIDSASTLAHGSVLEWCAGDRGFSARLGLTMFP